ncbi:uncharacterized protein LOC110925077 [Helianthus annuus]|uniref:uncharacterized protein LOC110925077 n=1 Tax=Helianthus annuus TaxID=4232 RepID=UPI000B905B40|nr:uncharacterized protein LOC110925077 [Helianthus annuus]
MSSSSDEENAGNFFLGMILETAKIVAEMEEDGEDEETSQPRTRVAALNRDREGAYERLAGDYFSKNYVYTNEQFGCRFQMSRQLFVRIANDLANYDDFFTLRYDGRGRRGFTTFQKCTSPLCQLAYGTASDSWNESLTMSERMSWGCLYEFFKGIVNLYRKVYLRRPTKKDIGKLYTFHEETHGFPGMLGSIDCTHWQWCNCPVAWCDQYMSGDIGYPSIILEAACSQDLWIWHALFGVVGSNNDLNLLTRSHVFDDIDSSFMLNGVSYKHGYYLADDTYPSYTAMVKTIPELSDEKRKKMFAKWQELARRDVERLFDVIKAKWGIIQQPAHAFEPKKVRYIMYACLILQT